MFLKEMIYQLVLNISLLALVATLISRIQLIQDIILEEQHTFKNLTIISFVFGGIIILATATGMMVGEYNLNTKIIGALAAGILGGPLVGIYSSLIGAAYVYIFSPNPAFALGSAFSTLLIGMLGGGFYSYFQRGKWKYIDLFILTSFAEICEMIMLLRMTVPLQMALETVLEISIPITLINSFGMLIFISCFNTVFIRQDVESSRQLEKANELMKYIFPIMKSGINDKKAMAKMLDKILKQTGWVGVMLTDTENVLLYKQKKWPALPKESIPESIPLISKEAIDSQKMILKTEIPKKEEWDQKMEDMALMAAPIREGERSVGTLVVWLKKQWVLRKTDAQLFEQICSVATFSLSLLELEKQKYMREKAEFHALQFQVNPHFLFNALNTISFVCREDPGRARQLLLILANYFRYNLETASYMHSMEEELQHVKDYLQIEKARFEEKLEIIYHIPKEVPIRIPTLILQPIVENAVRYGISSDGRRRVAISVREEELQYEVQITDQGKGFSEEILEQFRKGDIPSNHIGLSNVDQRMKSIYGKEYGLQIHSSEKGSRVSLYFPKDRTKGREEML